MPRVAVRKAAPRVAVRKAAYAVVRCLSLRLSVTFVNFIETSKISSNFG